MTPTISLNFKSPITWKDALKVPPLIPKEVHVWKVSVGTHFSELFKEYRGILNLEEIIKARRYYRQNDVERYVTGRILLRVLSSAYLSLPLTSVSFGTESGKPTITGADIKYNLSYTCDCILLSFGRCETGIDVEFVKSDFDCGALINNCFSMEEIDAIGRDERLDRKKFFVQWTRKEAILKCTGQGIVDDLTAIPSLDGTYNLDGSKIKVNSAMDIVSFDVNSQCVGSIALPINNTIKFLQWS